MLFAFFSLSKLNKHWHKLLNEWAEGFCFVCSIFYAPSVWRVLAAMLSTACIPPPSRRTDIHLIYLHHFYKKRQELDTATPLLGMFEASLTPMEEK